MRRVELTFTSDLASPPDRVWSWITSMRGISQELAPILKMTAPKRITDIGDVKVQPGQRLFRSWVLLFGILPIDRSDLTLLRLEAGKGFLEQSPMLSMSLWRHERQLEASGDGTRLTDRLSFEPRFATFVTRWFIRAVFNHRHRVLQQHFGVLGRGGSRVLSSSAV
jgi:ligand-binding SRPBCC domain-containing protein